MQMDAWGDGCRGGENVSALRSFRVFVMRLEIGVLCGVRVPEIMGNLSKFRMPFTVELIGIYSNNWPLEIVIEKNCATLILLRLLYF